MEKKEMRDRLVQLCVKAYMFGSEQVIIDLPSLIGFVEAELDKAREETRQEERDMFIVRYATVSFNEVIKTIKTLSVIEFLSIKWGLKGKKKSKLTTK